MSEPFPTLDELRNVQNAVERDRVIRETWEALVAAVGEWEVALKECERYSEMDEPDERGRAVSLRKLNYTENTLAGKAIAYVKARTE